MEKEKLFEMAGEVYRNVPAYIDLARDRDIDIASLTEFEIGRASCRKECRSRWSPYH